MWLGWVFGSSLMGLRLSEGESGVGEPAEVHSRGCRQEASVPHHSE